MASRKPKANSIYDDARKVALKQFRNNIKELKKKGLISKKYDARSVKQTKYLKSVVKKFEDVLFGKAKVVKVPPKKKKEYKDVGYKTSGRNRVVVPTDKNQTIKVNKKGDIVRTRHIEGGGTMQEVFLPIKYENLEQWLNEANDEKWDELLGPNERWAMIFYGKNSLMTFPTIAGEAGLAEYLMYYPHIQSAINENDYEDMQDVYQHLAIFKTTQRILPRSPKQGSKYSATRRQAAYERKKMRIDHMSDKEFDNYTRRESERRKAYYKNIVENDSERHERIKEQARINRKKNYKKIQAAKRKRGK